jgi:hypothetical protein
MQMKKVFTTILSSPFVIIMFLSSYGFLKMGTRSIDNSIPETGVISSIKDSKYLEIRLEGIDKTFTIFQTTQDYANIIEQIDNSDIVTIYTGNETYTQIVQLTKNDKIIYSETEFRTKYILVSIVSFIGGLFFVYILVRNWRK